MTTDAIVRLTAAGLSGALALVVLWRGRRSLVTGCFVAGMVALGIETICGLFSAQATLPNDGTRWRTLALTARSFLPGFWLCFSLVYARGNQREFLRDWRIPLVLAFLLPIGVALGFRPDLVQVNWLAGETTRGWFLEYGTAGNTLCALGLVGSVLILSNLEKTFRAAVGTMRWRIKFVVLGLALLFGTRLYTASQALLFSAPDSRLATVEAWALLLAGGFMLLAYLRRGFAAIDVYPSRAVLQNSLTILFAGAYLLVVGVLARVANDLGFSGTFQLQALLILLGSAALAVILLSDRFRARLQYFVSRHFRRPQHDHRKVWTTLTQRVSIQLDPPAYCEAAVRFVSETFRALSVTLWLKEADSDLLRIGGSTRSSLGENSFGMPSLTRPIEFEKLPEPWAEKLRQLNPKQFLKGGPRWCAPLRAGERALGLLVLADRVNGTEYAPDEIDLLDCIANQLAADLLNLRLTNELLQARELEAFQTVSAFFAHDLKNAAASLTLMIQNLREHFDDPEFREDAVRGLGQAVGRINGLLERASTLRSRLELSAQDADLNQLVRDALENVGCMPGVEIIQELHPLPPVTADRQHLESVVTNLLLNARDALNGRGQIRITTNREEGRAVLSLADNGCGMNAKFLRDSLFRPFQSTKKKGLGIGMFQARRIVQAHGGSIVAESAPERGTTFIVSLPLKPTAP